MKDGISAGHFLKSTALHLDCPQRGMEDLLSAFVHSADNTGEY